MSVPKWLPVIRSGNLDVVRSLDIDFGEFYEEQEENSSSFESWERNALALAIDEKNVAMIKLLLVKKGAPLDKDCRKFHLSKKMVFNVFRSSCTPLGLAIKNAGEFDRNDTPSDGDGLVDDKELFAHTQSDTAITIFYLLLEHGADPEAVCFTNSYGESYTAFGYALSSRQDEMAKHLVEKGVVDLNAKCRGMSPLVQPGSSGCSSCFSMNKITDPGCNALGLAISLQNLEMVKFLLDRGADVNKPCEEIPSYDSTMKSAPLECAIQSHSSFSHKVDNPVVLDILKVLLDYGASKTSVNEKGETVIDIARESKKQDIIDVINEYVPQRKMPTREVHNKHAAQVCKLEGCEKEANLGYDFCCLEHGQEYNRPKKQCMLSSCSNLANPGFDFCCLEHGQEYNRQQMPKKQCMLPSCSNLANPGFDFCCLEHGQGYNKMEADMDDCERKQRCTFEATGKAFFTQPWFNCKTCFKSDNEGACSVCARTCHKGHALEARQASLFFCDCHTLSQKCQFLCLSGECRKTVNRGFDFCCLEHGQEYNRQQMPKRQCMLSSCSNVANPGFSFCCREHGQAFNKQQMSENQLNQCMLSSCSNAVIEGYDFCCREHGEQMLAMMKKCVLPSCLNVAVKGFDFCCLEHSKEMLRWRSKKMCTMPSCPNIAAENNDLCSICMRYDLKQLLTMSNIFF